MIEEQIQRGHGKTKPPLPRDTNGNIQYESGNFFQCNEYSDGLPRPRGAHQPSSWDSLYVDPDVLSSPAPAWQQPHTRHGLLNRITKGPFFDLGYHAHCYACMAYFATIEWAQNHQCPKENAFRDATNRLERDYSALRKAAKQARVANAASSTKATTRKPGIFATIKRMFRRD